MGSLRTVIVIKPNLHEEEHANSTQNEAQTSNLKIQNKSVFNLHQAQQTPVFKQQECGSLNSAFSLYFSCSVMLAGMYKCCNRPHLWFPRSFSPLNSRLL